MPRIVRFLERIPPRLWFGIVSLVALAERCGLFLLYQPVAYNDTGSYRRLAEAILGGWGRYDGTRVPGYPLFLALFGADRNVYAAQLALGLLTTSLLFYIGWRLSGRGWFGALAALVHTLDLQQLLFEADLISETLATFLIALVLAGMLWLLVERERPVRLALAAAALVGLCGALAALTRPLFIFLPFLAAFCILVLGSGSWKLRWGTALSAGLAGLAALAIWVGFFHHQYHRWGLTTMTGYHLVQHTGIFFEYVPDEYAAVRDTYLDYRDRRIAETGSPGNAIWDAIPALENVSGLSFYDLSDLLTRISVQLILKHPLLYLKNVTVGWIWFWKAPVYWSAESLRSVWLGRPMEIAILVERGLLVAANLVFVLVSLSMPLKKLRRILGMDPFLWFASSAIWSTSILQTLLDHGDNPRFLVPVQSLVVLIVLCWSVRVVDRMRKKT